MAVTPAEAARELLARRRARKNPADFARYVEVPGAPAGTIDEDDELVPLQTALAKHHILILDAAKRCIDKHSGRLMLFFPPGSAKSTYGSIVIPAWIMGANPNYRVIGVSHGSDLARKMGRRTRSIVKQPAYERLFNCGLSAESSAADEWALTNGSEYMSGGILSGITGNRADLVLVDDPVKGRQEADSEVVRQRTMDEYQESVLTRLKPGGSVIYIGTRWHEDDPAGRILPENYNGESGEILCRDGMVWDVLCVPAQCERADDPLGREIGEYLWPEWFPETHWDMWKRIPRTWTALYQQRPAPDTGSYFQKEWIKLVPRGQMPLKNTLSIYGGSDYAVTGDGGDHTVHVVVGLDPSDRMWLLDLWRAQATSDVWVDSFCDLVLKWQPIGWAEETGQIKSGVGPFLTKRMMQRQAYVARELFPTRGDKAIRAQSIRGRMSLSGLYVAEDAPFLADLMRELLSFPVGAGSPDQVDALGLVGQLMDKMATGQRPKEAQQQDYGAVYAKPLPMRNRR